MKNPYSELVNVMRSEGSRYNPPTVSIGKVTSKSPLKVIVGDLELDSDNLLVNHLLLENTQTVTDSSLLHNHSEGDILYKSGIVQKDTLTFKQVIEEDDLLAILPTADGQTFIVLCKVVTP